MGKHKIAACFVLHDDSSYLANALSQIPPDIDRIAFVSRLPWHSTVGDWQACVDVATPLCKEIVLGDWPHESGPSRMRARLFRTDDREYTAL